MNKENNQNKNKKKTLFIVLGIILLVGIIGGIFFYNKMSINQNNIPGIFSAGFLRSVDYLNEKQTDYTNKNMTVSFKDDSNNEIGQATLKSHSTYDEIKKITAGKNKTVIWYEFDFTKEQLNAIGDVEFIDMREFIENKSYTSQFKDIEEMNQSLILISNQDYLLPVNKNYTLVYQNEKREWQDYNSKEIPKEKIIIGVQTDLAWGEFLDVQLNILNNKLDRHALVFGTHGGFVTEAPTGDPGGSYSTTIDNWVFLIKDTSDATAARITEIGWYCNVATEESNFEVGLYDHTEANATNLLYSDTVNAKGTDAGWKIVSVDWTIDPNTDYWLGLQLDDTATTTTMDTSPFSGGNGFDRFTYPSLPNPAGGGAIAYSTGFVALYAVWDTGGDSEYPQFSNYWDNNASLVDSGTGLFNVTITSTNGTVLLQINNTNMTATNLTANVYNVSYDFTSAGNYPYQWISYGNGSNNNFNISITNYYTINSSVSDSCTCPGVNNNWQIDMSDNCVISTDCNLGTGRLNFTGTGQCNVSAMINTTGMGYPPENSILYMKNGSRIYMI